MSSSSNKLELLATLADKGVKEGVKKITTALSQLGTTARNAAKETGSLGELLSMGMQLIFFINAIKKLSESPHQDRR